MTILVPAQRSPRTLPVVNGIFFIDKLVEYRAQLQGFSQGIQKFRVAPTKLRLAVQL